MKRVFGFILLIFISHNVFSQMQVKENSFKHIPNAVMDDKYDHTDGNDLPMALIKISTENISEQERLKLLFSGNRATQIVKTPKTGQMWIYITANSADFIEIKHPDFGTCKYYLPEQLCDFCIYEMVLQYNNPKPEMGFVSISSEPQDADIYIDGEYYGKTNNVITDLTEGQHVVRLEKDGYSTLTKNITIVKGETLKINEKMIDLISQMTFLVVKADQADALIYIDDELLSTGEASKSVTIGTTHTYMIECNLYHNETGSVTVNEKTVINKELRPAFGYIYVSTTPEQGAKVYVDGNYIGESPIKTDKLANGTHKIRVMKDMFKMTEQSFTVYDGQTTNANIALNANFVTVTVNTDSESDIYIDEECKGKGRWTGRLSDGSHIFEARKTNHKTSKKTAYLVLGKTEIITLDAPKPISGGLEVNSSPMEANIYIDGKLYGQTPNYINEVLVGSHELKLEKSGFETMIKTIIVKEGEVLKLNEKMEEKMVVENNSLKEENHKNSEDEVLKVVEEMPEFPGGSAQMMRYIQNNIRYPMTARESDIQGRVFVSFVVEPDGSITNVEVTRGIGGGCDEEALRLVQSMPNWKPGKVRGSAVRVSYTLPIVFKLTQ